MPRAKITYENFTPEQLKEELERLNEEVKNLRVDIALGRESNVHKLKETRHRIAIVKTLLTEYEKEQQK